MDKPIYSHGLREAMVIKTLPWGLKCYIMPKKDYVEKTALLAVNYGAEDIDFFVDGHIVTTPSGTAHFLEHKMFEDPETDIFREFTKVGGYVNAFTNYNTTAYHFTCTHHFLENLRLLLRLVGTPYFTDENVDKEMGIITQEIQMYQDYPSWRVFFNMQAKMYQNLHINKDITGREEDVRSINKEALYASYNAFYHPSNMALVCIGDFCPEDIFEALTGMDTFFRKNKTAKSAGVNGEHLFVEEPAAVSQSFTSEAMPLSRPLFQLGFKDNFHNGDKLFTMMGTKVLLDYITGESTDFYEKQYNNGLIDSSFNAEYICGPNYGTSIFGSYCDNPKQFREVLFSEITKVKQEGLEKTRLDRIIKKHRGQFIRSFNAIEQIANLQADLFNKELSLFDVMDCFDHLTPSRLENRLLQHFDFDTSVLSVVEPL